MSPASRGHKPYPGGVDPSVYLLDIDACGDTVLAGVGIFDDLESAAAAASRGRSWTTGSAAHAT
jgi:hypothetical protein